MTTSCMDINKQILFSVILLKFATMMVALDFTMVKNNDLYTDISRIHICYFKLLLVIVRYVVFPGGREVPIFIIFLNSKKISKTANKTYAIGHFQYYWYYCIHMTTNKQVFWKSNPLWIYIWSKCSNKLKAQQLPKGRKNIIYYD